MNEIVKNWLVNYGAMAENWRLSIENIKQKNAGSDWLIIELYIYKPRAKKPFYFWKMCVNGVRKIVDLEQCEHYAI